MLKQFLIYLNKCVCICQCVLATNQYIKLSLSFIFFLLQPIVPAPTTSSLQNVAQLLSSDGWRRQFDGLTELRRLTRHHSSLMTQPTVGKPGRSCSGEWRGYGEIVNGNRKLFKKGPINVVAPINLFGAANFKSTISICAVNVSLLCFIVKLLGIPVSHIWVYSCVVLSLFIFDVAAQQTFLLQTFVPLLTSLVDNLRWGKMNIFAV